VARSGFPHRRFHQDVSVKEPGSLRVDSDMRLVVLSNSNNGASPPGKDWIASGFLNPVKSRVRLQLALANGLDFASIRGKFENTLVNYVYA